MQGVWLRGVGFSSHICSFCHASSIIEAQKSAPKVRICAGQGFSRKSETFYVKRKIFSEECENNLNKLHTVPTLWPCYTVDISKTVARVGGICQPESEICQSQPPIFVCRTIGPGHHAHTALIVNGWIQS